MPRLRHRLPGMPLLLALVLVAPSWADAQDTPAAEVAPPAAATADDPTLRLAERVARAVRRGELTRDEADAFQRYVARRMLAGPIKAAEIDALFLAEIAEPGAHTQAPPPEAPVRPAPPEPSPERAPATATGVPPWALAAGLVGLLALVGLVGWRIRAAGSETS